LINAMLGVEAIRTAHEKFGKKPLTGEQVRWELETGRIQTWDGKTWNIASD
jgi:hypothetical protein